MSDGYFLDDQAHSGLCQVTVVNYSLMCVSVDRLCHLLENWSIVWEVGSSIPGGLTLRVLK